MPELWKVALDLDLYEFLAVSSSASFSKDQCFIVCADGDVEVIDTKDDHLGSMPSVSPHVWIC